MAKRGMTGATGNIYAGLHEFEEMGFTLHLLRPGDVFGDIGANIGSYTVLASGVAGARSLSVEPVRRTFEHLKNNVAVNNLETLVGLYNNGMGEESGKLCFTRDYDTVNHVITAGEASNIPTEEVDIITMDALFSTQIPALIKMDVEGFELSVLKGGTHILEDRRLKAILIELNDSCDRYGVKEEDIHRLLLSYDFKPVTYDPLERKLTELPTHRKHGNTIYIRDEEWVRNRLTSARKITVSGQVF